MQAVAAGGSRRGITPNDTCITDVPHIQFRVQLAGYPATYQHPVPAPHLAKSCKVPDI